MKVITLIFFIAFNTCLFGQLDYAKDIGDSADVTDVLKLTFLNPGIAYEKKVGKYQTFYAHAYMSTSFEITYTSNFGNHSDIYFDPAFNFQYRYYYNAIKRSQKKKRTAVNSMNYIAPDLSFLFSKTAISTAHLSEENRRLISQLGFVWGLQRNYPKHFSLDLNLGLGYMFAKGTVNQDSGTITRENKGHFAAILQLNLGFWLNR
jgi:hypothetical protein